MRLARGALRAASLALAYGVHVASPHVRPRTGLDRRGPFEARAALEARAAFVAYECFVCSLCVAHRSLTTRLFVASPSMCVVDCVLPFRARQVDRCAAGHARSVSVTTPARPRRSPDYSARTWRRT